MVGETPPKGFKYSISQYQVRKNQPHYSKIGGLILRQSLYSVLICEAEEAEREHTGNSGIISDNNYHLGLGVVELLKQVPCRLLLLVFMPCATTSLRKWAGLHDTCNEKDKAEIIRYHFQV